MGNDQTKDIDGKKSSLQKYLNGDCRVRRLQMGNDELIKFCEKFYKQVDVSSTVPHIGSSLQVNCNKLVSQKKEKEINSKKSFQQVVQQKKTKFKANSPYRQKDVQQNTKELNKQIIDLQFKDNFKKSQPKQTNTSTIMNKNKEQKLLQINGKEIGIDQVVKQIRISKDQLLQKYKEEKEKQKTISYKICYDQFCKFMQDINNYNYKQDFVNEVSKICDSHIEDLVKSSHQQSNDEWKQYLQFLSMNWNINYNSVLLEDQYQGVELFKKLMQIFMNFIERVNKRALRQIENVCKKTVQELQCQLSQQNKLLTEYQKIIVNLTMDLQLQHSVMISHLNYEQKICGIPILQKIWSEPLPPSINNSTEEKSKMSNEIFRVWKQGNQIQQSREPRNQKEVTNVKKCKVRKPLFSSSEQDNQKN